MEAAAGGVRARAVTREDGEAVLELGLPSSPSQDIPVQFSLDGSPLGVVPLSTDWRTGLLRK